MMTWLVVTYVWLLLYTNLDIMSTVGAGLLGYETVLEVATRANRS